MQSILTLCPRCQTSFKVSDKQLAIAEGFVRCGSCLDVFSATANRITIKQTPTGDAEEDIPEDDQYSEEHLLDGESPPQQNIEDTASEAFADNAAAIQEQDHSLPKYNVSQLVDADAVIPVNVATAIRASSYSSGESAFVFDDTDDIPLGDMVLDEIEFDQVAYFEAENNALATDESDDANFDVFHEEYEKAAQKINHARDDITISPAALQSEPVMGPEGSHTDTLFSAADLDSSSSRTSPEIADRIPMGFAPQAARIVGNDVVDPAIPHDDLYRQDGIFHEGAAPANTFAAIENATTETFDAASAFITTVTDVQTAEDAPSSKQGAQFASNPLISSIAYEGGPAGALELVFPDDRYTAAKIAQDLPPNQLDQSGSGYAPAAEGLIADSETDAAFHNIYDAGSFEPAYAGSVLDNYAGAPDTDMPVNNREDLYEPFTAAIAVRASAGDSREPTAQRANTSPDDDESLDFEDTFTADHLPHTEECGVDGFSAFTVDDADADDELATTTLEKSPGTDKEQMRGYLAGLEDADALEPLSPATMDTIEADPLTMEVGHNLRRLVTNGGWLFLSVVFVVVFAFQVVADNLELMQKSPVYSRYLPLFCTILDCPGPTETEVQNLVSQDLLVRSHPTVRGALEVSFIFRNDADLPQPFPLIELSFADSSNRLMANRSFTPDEYLPTELAALDAMPARSSVQVMLELVDPGSEAVNYQIDFREAE